MARGVEVEKLLICWKLCWSILAANRRNWWMQQASKQLLPLTFLQSVALFWKEKMFAESVVLRNGKINLLQGWRCEWEKLDFFCFKISFRPPEAGAGPAVVFGLGENSRTVVEEVLERYDGQEEEWGHGKWVMANHQPAYLLFHCFHLERKRKVMQLRKQFASLFSCFVRCKLGEKKYFGSLDLVFIYIFLRSSRVSVSWR